MQENVARFFSAKLGKLTTELRSLDHGLKSNPPLDAALLREFRQALDNVRMTAWTVHELLNARESQRNPEAVISFLTAERVRRFGQMARDLYDDLEQQATVWPTQAARDLGDALTFLGARLAIVGEKIQQDPTATRK